MPSPNCYPKEYRLTKRLDFKKVFYAKNRLIGHYICIDFCDNTKKNTRLGITVSSKFGNAVARNRFKRIAREAFRQNRTFLQIAKDINIAPRSCGMSAKSADIRTELLKLITCLQSK